MALKYLAVTVLLNETAKMTIEIPEWELQILEAVHGPEHCVVEGRFLFDRDPPDAQAEFERLRRRYKTMPNSDVFYATAVYGMNAAGHQRLAELIERAYEPDQPMGFGDEDPDESAGTSQQTAPVVAHPRAPSSRRVSPGSKRKPAARAGKEKTRRAG